MEDNLDPKTTDNQDPNQDQGKTQDQKPPEHFADGFNEEVRSHPSVRKFKSTEEMARGYVNLEKKIGAKGVIIPGDNAPQEEVDAYYKALGRPDKSDDYKVHVLPEDQKDDRLNMSPEAEKEFKEMAYRHGLSAKQALGLHKDYVEMQARYLKQFDEGKAEERKTAETTLRKEWGAKFSEKISRAKSVLEKYGSKELSKFLEEGEGNNPHMIRLLANIGDSLSEDQLGPKGQSGLTMSPAEAQQEINKIMGDPRHPYFDDRHPTHVEAVKYVRSLYQMVHSGGNK